MGKNKDRWSALSMKERADLINMYITNGISDLKEMKKHYNGIPYRDLNTSDYDYFNASPEMIPTKEGQHWDSRNPHTGQILKSENHPTFDLAVEAEKNAGYKIVRGYDGNLYSIPNTPNNYVEDYNSFGDGGRILDGTEEEQTLNGEPIYYDDTYIEPAVVKAFKSQEDYNRYQGEKFGKQIVNNRDKLANKIGTLVYDVAQFHPILGTALDIADVVWAKERKDALPEMMSTDGKILPLIDKIGKTSKVGMGTIFGKILQFPDMAFDALKLIEDLNKPISEYSNGGKLSLFDNSFGDGGNSDNDGIMFNNTSVQYSPKGYETFLHNKVVPIPELYKNPYFGVLSSLFNKNNPGKTEAIKYYLEVLKDDPEYLSRIKNGIYNYTPYAESLEFPILQDIKSVYLHSPQTFNSIDISDYKPKGAEKNTYYKSKILEGIGAGLLVKAGENLKDKKIVTPENGDVYKEGRYGDIQKITKKGNGITILPGLGHATVGVGHDDRGEYISYYDDWNVGNFTPDTKHLLDFLNESVPIYGRIYLDDYYDIPEEFRGNPFITPAVVTAEAKKANGGNLNKFDTEGDARYFAEHYKKYYNNFSTGGDTNSEEKTSFWKRLLESGQSARDARVGAVGAQQVRDLYSEGKTEEAKELAKKYAKANTTGIALASGAATSSLLGDLAVTGATTTADTLIDGDVNDFGKNFLYNAAADVVGHGIGKYIFNRLPSNISEEATNKIKALLSRFPNGVESVNDISKELKDRLIKEGVDPSLLTKSNLRKMTYLRSQDILNSDAPGKFATRESSKVSNTYNLYNNTNGEIRRVGYISAYPENGVGRIKMVENITEQTPDRVGGVSELGYNTVIKDIGASRNGDVLMQPDKTLKVLDKYPDKKVVSNEGEWLRNGKYTEGNPVFLMETPTYNVPIKYTDDFSTDGLDKNGNFILDFTKGPLLKFGGKLNKFVTGGPTEEKYNIFEDKLSFERRDNHRKSLEDFVKQNPTIGGINTADFVEFFNQLSGLEGSYKKDAGKGMKYSGYYGLEGGRNYDESTQHKKAYEHLARLFKSSIVKEDLARGIELGFTPAQILAKYWNQGNRVTNYLYNGINDSDGVGSLISDYGWNMTADVDYSNYLPQGITDDYVIVKDWRTLGRTIPLVRNSYINYSDRENSIIDLNTKIKRARTGNPSVVFDPNRLQVNDTIWLRPLTFKEKVK